MWFPNRTGVNIRQMLYSVCIYQGIRRQFLHRFFVEFDLIRNLGHCVISLYINIHSVVRDFLLTVFYPISSIFCVT